MAFNVDAEVKPLAADTLQRLRLRVLNLDKDDSLADVPKLTEVRTLRPSPLTPFSLAEPRVFFIDFL